MKIPRYIFFAFVLSVSVISCNRRATVPMSLDTLGPSAEPLTPKPPAAETISVATTLQPALPPIARAIVPERLAGFLPNMPGWATQGELQKELHIQDSINFSRVWQVYTMGTKTATVQINDFAYVPSYYAPYQKYKGTYLEDNNDERVESTTISGYPAVQTMDKKAPHAALTIFPGNRYVVSISEDGADNINDVRQIGKSMNLNGLDSLQ